jgi:magnesium transporter
MSPGHNASQVVACAAYAEGRRVADVALEDISEVLKQEDRFVWIGLYEPDEALLKEVQAEFGLHDLAIEDAHLAHQRPKLERYGDSLFIALRTAQPDREQGRIAFGETHLFVGARYVVSVRHGASLSYADVRTRCEGQPQLLAKGPAFVLHAIMDFVVDQYFPIVDGLGTAWRALETRSSASASTARPPCGSTLKRDLLEMKRGVSPLVDICNRLMRADLDLIPTMRDPTSATCTTTRSGSTRRWTRSASSSAPRSRRICP